MKLAIHFIFFLFCALDQVQAQHTFLKFSASTGSLNSSAGVSTYHYPEGLSFSNSLQGQINPVSLHPLDNSLNSFLPLTVIQSSVANNKTVTGADYYATVQDLYDLDYTTGARTSGNGNTQTITIDLGQLTTFSSIQLAPISAANLNGAALQTSVDNNTWTPMVSSTDGLPLGAITSAVNSSLSSFYFASVTARYVRVTKYTGQLDLSEFRVLPTVSQSSGTVAVATASNLYNNLVTAAGATLATTAGQWIMQDLGCNRSFAAVKLSALIVGNLNGAALQVSADGAIWATVTCTNAATGQSADTIKGVSAVYPITYTFAPQSARYVRLYKSTAAIVEAAEFQIDPKLAVSSAASLAFFGTEVVIDNAIYTDGVTTTNTVGIAQWVVLNLGCRKTFSHLQLSTITTTANLDGSAIQTSSDGVNWNTQLSNITGSSITQLVTYFFAAPVTAQYVRVIKNTTGAALLVSEMIVSPAVTLSSGTKPSRANFGGLYDNFLTSTVATLKDTNQFVMLDLGSNKNFAMVRIAAGSVVANLDGAALQVSTDGIAWISVSIKNEATGLSGNSFANSVTTYPITYSFSPQTARYIRVFRASAGIVALSEFIVSPAVFQSSATSLANNALPTQLTDSVFTNGALTATAAGIKQFVGLNFGQLVAFNTIELAPMTTEANLNGAKIQVSTNGLNWTSIAALTNLTTGLTDSIIADVVLNKRTIYSFLNQNAQYIRIIQFNGTAVGLSECKVGGLVFQSSGTALGTMVNLTDNQVAEAAVTDFGENQWVRVDLGATQSFNFVQLAASAAVENLNGAALQVSPDGNNWTTLTIKNNRTGTTSAVINGANVINPDVFSFATVTARYVRVFRADFGAVELSEFKVAPAVFQSSGIAQATAINLYDNNLISDSAVTERGTLSSPAFIALNLGGIKTFSRVELATTSPTNLNGASLEASNDGLSWNSIVAHISGMVGGQINVLSFASTSARYIRIKSISMGLSVSEFRVVSGTTISKKIIAPTAIASISAVEPIGFIFNLNGVDYSNFSVSVNGLLRLGNTLIIDEAINNTVSSTNSATLFAYWDDISRGSAATFGGVTKTISGDAPNRKLVVEWRSNNTAISGATNLVFQIALHEGTNQIEYLYGQGLDNISNASIGLAIGNTAATKSFYSITPSATVANTSYSNMVPNDKVNLWPGNGTVYSFTPTLLPSAASVPADFKTLDNAISAINWASAPNVGGYTITVNGDYNETVPMGYSTVPGGATVAKYSGLLLNASGTADKPIKIQWKGNDAKPVLTANTGVGLNDYIIALAGSDYVTIDGFSLIENAANATTPTNTKWTEMGIALFKKNVGTNSIGANGCSYNTIKNCQIALERNANGVLSTQYYAAQGVNLYANYVDAFTKGIAMVYWTPVLDMMNNSSNAAIPLTAGLLTQADVNSYNQIYGNTISKTYYGIFGNELYRNTTVVGQGNTIGKIGQGNAINTFGALTGIVYSAQSSYSNNFAKGIAMGGYADGTIEYNTLTNGYANANGVAGIYLGTTESNAIPSSQLKAVAINYNTIAGLFANKGAPATNTASATGIRIGCTHWNAPQSITAIADLNITNNSISDINTTAGAAVGIKSFSPSSTEMSTTVNAYTQIDGPAQLANISTNTIKQVKAIGSANSIIYPVAGIIWGGNYSKTQIDSNTISRLVMGNTAVNPNPAVGSMLYGISFQTAAATALRASVNINANTIQNDSVVVGTGTATTVTARMIHVAQGGLVTNVNNNLIQNNDFSYAYDDGYQGEGKIAAVIEALALPNVDTSWLNIKNNTLTNNIRRGIRAGAYSFFTGINVINSEMAQYQTIANNTINGLEMRLGSTPSTPSTLSILTGINVKGNYTNVSSLIIGNTITGLKSEVARSNLAAVNAANACGYNVFGVRGIVVDAVKRADINKNLVYNNTTLTSNGSINNLTSLPSTLDGNLGIGVIGSNNAIFKNNVYAVNNNFVYDLKADSMNALLATTGVFVNRYGNFNVDHNTIVIGNPLTAGAASSVVTSAGVFGTSGIIYAPLSLSSGTRLTSKALEQYTFRNNIISIQATNKGVGASMAIRQLTPGVANKYPGDITAISTGNSYYVNAGAYNYLYGQGITANITGGIKNCFAVSGATANTTYNLVNNVDFNSPCGKYKTFMAGAEATSSSDLNVGASQSAVQPFVGGAIHPTKFTIAAGSSSFVYGNARVEDSAVVLKDDYALTNSRPALQSTAGAFQAAGTAKFTNTFTLHYNGIMDALCSSNPIVNVDITQLVPTVAIATGLMAPRLYYKRSTNTNQLPNGAAENVNTFNGWKWVNASSISGNRYSFTLDMAKLNGASATPATIEYFIVAADDASYNGTRNFVVAGTAISNCINNVDLYSSGGNSRTAQVPPLDGGAVATLTVCDKFEMLGPASVNRYTYIDLDNTRTLANTNDELGKIVCSFSKVKVKGQYFYISDSTLLDVQGFQFQASTDANFTTLQSFVNLTTNEYDFSIAAHPSSLYVRMVPLCSGSLMKDWASPYIYLTTIGCPLTEAQPDQTACMDQPLNVLVKNSSTSSDGPRQYFVQNNLGQAFSTVGSQQSTQATVTTAASSKAVTGVWSAVVGLSKNINIVGGYLQADLLADNTNQRASLTELAGMNFTTTTFIKFNSVSLADDVMDGDSTTGFKLALYDAGSKNKLYETDRLGIGNGKTITVNFTDWYLGSGSFNLVIERFNRNNAITGKLLSPLSVATPVFKTNFCRLPLMVTNDLSINGSITDNNSHTLSNQYSYFLDWNVDAYCTDKPVKSFLVSVIKCVSDLLVNPQITRGVIGQ